MDFNLHSGNKWGGGETHLQASFVFYKVQNNNSKVKTCCDGENPSPLTRFRVLKCLSITSALNITAASPPSWDALINQLVFPSHLEISGHPEPVCCFGCGHAVSQI